MKSYQKEARELTKDAIWESLNKAKKKHPSWDGMSYQSMICVLAEEMGEAARALNDVDEKNDPLGYSKFFEEIADVGAVVYRILDSMYVSKHNEKTEGLL